MGVLKTYDGERWTGAGTQGDVGPTGPQGAAGDPEVLDVVIDSDVMNFDLAEYRVFRMPLSAALTGITVTNWPTTGQFGQIILIMPYVDLSGPTGTSGLFSTPGLGVGWPLDWVWEDGAFPVSPSAVGETVIVSAWSLDGGATIYASTGTHVESDAPATVPSLPTNVTMPQAGPVDDHLVVSVAWEGAADDGGSPIIAYHLQRYEDNVLVETIVVSPTAAKSYTISDAIHDVTYRMVVFAQNAIGYSSGAPVEGTPLATWPLAPTNLTCFGGVEQATVLWDPFPLSSLNGTPFVRYVVDLVEGADTSWTIAVAQRLTIGETSVVVTGLLPDTDYQFRVRVESALGGSGPGSLNTTASHCTTDAEGDPVEYPAFELIAAGCALNGQTLPSDAGIQVGDVAVVIGLSQYQDDGLKFVSAPPGWPVGTKFLGEPFQVDLLATSKTLTTADLTAAIIFGGNGGEYMWAVGRNTDGLVFAPNVTSYTGAVDPPAMLGIGTHMVFSAIGQNNSQVPSLPGYTLHDALKVPGYQGSAVWSKVNVTNPDIAFDDAGSTTSVNLIGAIFQGLSDTPLVTVADPITDLVAVPGVSEVTTIWTEPELNGGTLTGYQVDRSIGGVWTNDIASGETWDIPVQDPGTHVPILGPEGRVQPFANMRTFWDQYTTDASLDEKTFIATNFHKPLVYSPYWDDKLTWKPDVLVYDDIAAIYNPAWVGNEGRTLATDHPEWILRDGSDNQLFIPFACSGGTCPQYAGDIGDPLYRAHVIARIQALVDEGYTSVFLDDINLDMRVGDGTGADVVPIDERTGIAMTDTAWATYMVEFVELARSTFPDIVIGHNPLWFADSPDFDSPLLLRQIAACDLVYIERSFNDTGLVAGSDKFGIESLLTYLDLLHTSGKGLIYLDQNASDDAGHELNVAGALIMSNGKDVVGTEDEAGRLTPGDPVDVRYATDLGAAVTDRYMWEGVLRRDFVGGMVLYNKPGAAAASLTLPGAFTDMAGASITTLNMATNSGAILVGSPSLVGLSYTDGGRENGTPVSYRVSTVTDAGTSNPSNVATATPLGTFGAPAAPNLDLSGAITLTSASDVAATVNAAAAEAVFYMENGDYYFYDVFYKRGQRFVGESVDGVVVHGQSTHGKAFRGPEHDAVFANITFADFGDGTYNMWDAVIDCRGLYATEGSATIAHDVYVYNCKFIGASVGVSIGHRPIVSGCYFEGCNPQAISGGYGTGGRIWNNDIRDNGYYGNTGAGVNNAQIKITWWNIGPWGDTANDTSRFTQWGGSTPFTANDHQYEPPAQLVIANNRVVGTRDTTKYGAGDGARGIWFDLDCRNVRLTGNTFTDSFQYGIFAEGCNGIEVDGNQFNRCRTPYLSNLSTGFYTYGPYFGQGAVVADVSSNMNVHDNLFDDCFGSIVLFLGDRARGTADWNTAEPDGWPVCWSSRGEMIRPTYTPIAVGAASSVAVSNCSVVDNQLINGSYGVGYVLDDSMSASEYNLDTIEFSGNTYPSDVFEGYWNGVMHTSLGSWQTAGHDQVATSSLVLARSSGGYNRPGIGGSVQYLTSRTAVETFLDLGYEATAVVASGEYLAGQQNLNFKNRSGKTLWAENLHGTSWSWANIADANSHGANAVTMAGSDNIGFHGMLVQHARFYGIVLSGNTNFDGLPAHDIDVSFCKVANMYQSAVKADNGSESATPAYRSYNLSFTDSIIENVGLDSSYEFFCEGMYIGSGTQTNGQNAPDRVTIARNYIDCNQPSASSGESIELKIGSSNVTIIDNDIINTQTGNSTSGAAIAIWVNDFDYWLPNVGGGSGIIIENNRIRGVRSKSGTIYQKGNGLVLGCGATVRNNIITDCVDSAIAFEMTDSVSNGVFPADLAGRQVILEHNIAVGNGSMWGWCAGQGPVPQVVSQGNIYQSAGYSNGPNFTVQNDVVQTNADNLVSTTMAPSTLAGTALLRPLNDGTLVYTGNSTKNTDLFGNARPFGSNKHYGAIEA